MLLFFSDSLFGPKCSQTELPMLFPVRINCCQKYDRPLQTVFHDNTE